MYKVYKIKMFLFSVYWENSGVGYIIQKHTKIHFLKFSFAFIPGLVLLKESQFSQKLAFL